MATPSDDVVVPLDRLTIRRAHDATIAVVGAPNCGKSTLFNRLTGLRQKTANFSGVTVERHAGVVRRGERAVELLDLPGTHSLAPSSLDDRVAVDAVFGRLPGEPAPDAILAVVDASNLYQGLFLVSQLLELGLPMALAVTMMDAARASGRDIDVAALSQALGGVRVLPVVATTGEGIDALQETLFALPSMAPVTPPVAWPQMHDSLDKLGIDAPLARSRVTRAMVDGDALVLASVAELKGLPPARLDAMSAEVFGNEPALAVEARARYAWVRDVLPRVLGDTSSLARAGSRFLQWLNRPLPGTLALLVVMALVFQAVFAWATPLMDLIDGATAGLAGWVTASFGESWLTSLIADGLIAGVGSVVIFLPQILILFLFIIVLEDTGFLARAAYLTDRLMRTVGLSGQSVVPMISSFACAVPGIMGARVIPGRRDRIATILAAPFMTCSARLPVYALLIGAFVPVQTFLGFNLQGLVLFGLYLFGILMGVLTALLLKRTALQGEKPPFALMLPEFRRPNLRTVLFELLARARIFLRRAGTIILGVALIVWAAATYPNSSRADAYQAERTAAAQAVLEGVALDEALVAIDNEVSAMRLEDSALGRAGKFVEPVFRPLGWDWRLSSAVIAGFPAREVVVAILGTVYAVGDEADDATLATRLKSATWPDGRPIYTLPVVIGLMVFYALCLQCAATLAVIRRETNTWGWPIFAWSYMTALGYLGALAVVTFF